MEVGVLANLECHLNGIRAFGKHMPGMGKDGPILLVGGTTPQTQLPG